MTRKGPQELEDAVLACRRGDWRTGLNILSHLAQEVEGKVALPGYFYTYLGVAMARIEGRRREGIELCRYGVKRAPNDPQNRLNLATAYLINHDRRRAVREIRRGLSRNPSHKGLRAFQNEIGMRREPAISFLSRDNPLNILIGRLTYRAAKQREARLEEAREDAELERLAEKDS